MKLCTKCNVEKDESEFNKNRSRKDGLTPHCGQCIKDYTKSKKKKPIRDKLDELLNNNKDDITESDQIPLNLEEDIPELNENVVEEPEEMDLEQFERKKDSLKQKIRMYIENFPKLKKIIKELEKIENDPDIIDNMDILELEKLMNKIKTKVSSKNLNFLLEVGFYNCMINPLENICTKYTPIKVNGLEKALKQNEAVEDCLKEIAIKYSDYVEKAVEPEYRLLGLVAFTMMSMHTINTKKELTDKMKQQEIKKEQIDMFKGI